MQVSSFFRDIGNCGEIFNDKCVRHLACSYYVCFKTVCNGGFHVRCRQINYWSFVFETLSCTICMEGIYSFKVSMPTNRMNTKLSPLLHLDNNWQFMTSHSWSGGLCTFYRSKKKFHDVDKSEKWRHLLTSVFKWLVDSSLKFL